MQITFEGATLKELSEEIVRFYEIWQEQIRRQLEYREGGDVLKTTSPIRIADHGDLEADAADYAASRDTGETEAEPPAKSGRRRTLHGSTPAEPAVSRDPDPATEEKPAKEKPASRTKAKPKREITDAYLSKAASTAAQKILPGGVKKILRNEFDLPPTKMRELTQAQRKEFLKKLSDAK